MKLYVLSVMFHHELKNLDSEDWKFRTYGIYDDMVQCLDLARSLMKHEDDHFKIEEYELNSTNNRFLIAR